MKAARATVWLAAGALVALTLAAYANMFGVPFRFDDLESIAGNASIRQLWPPSALFTPPGGVTVSGRPVANVSLAVNYAISGLDPWSYHAVNLAIHIATGLLLFGIVRWTVKRRDGGRALPSTPFAFVAAAVWLLHPLQTESVTNVVQRVESLCGLFYLATVYAFVRATAPGAGSSPALEPKHAGRLRYGWLALSVGACAYGMATKEVMVTAPVVVLLYDRTFVAGTFRTAWRVRRGYYLALATTWLLLALLVAGAKGRGGTAGFNTEITSGQYALTQLHAVMLYLGRAIWPSGLVFDYGTGLMRGGREALLPGIAVAALAAGTIWASVRGGRWRVAGFLGAIFFVVLAPTTSVVPIATQTIAEHRMYLPLAAIAAGLGALVVGTVRHVWLVACALAAALTLVTWQRNEVYRDDVTLWRDVAAKRPNNERAHHNLALALAKAGREAEAIEAYRGALRVAPDYIEVHHDLGLLLLKAGKTDEALRHLETAARLDVQNPALRDVLGRALTRAGRPAEAIAHHKAALQLQPNLPSAHAGLGSALAQSGRATEALPHFQAALRARPNDAEALGDWGAALLQLDRIAEAIAKFETALKLDPQLTDVRSNLGFALLQMGQLDAAATQYRALLRLAPEDGTARSNLGHIALRQGNVPEAVAQYEALATRRADDPVAHYNFAAALLRAGRTRDAEAELLMALRLRGDFPEAQRMLADIRRRSDR